MVEERGTVNEMRTSYGQDLASRVIAQQYRAEPTQVERGRALQRSNLRPSWVGPAISSFSTFGACKSCSLSVAESTQLAVSAASEHS